MRERDFVLVGIGAVDVVEADRDLGNDFSVPCPAAKPQRRSDRAAW
jgi:hypothetical protein